VDQTDSCAADCVKMARMGLVLTVIAVILAIWGVLNILGGHLIWGILLIVLACAVGPGGWSIFGNRNSRI
jgi:multisubunit Na+/H+ antiporter MnhG subunit